MGVILTICIAMGVLCTKCNKQHVCNALVAVTETEVRHLPQLLCNRCYHL